MIGLRDCEAAVNLRILPVAILLCNLILGCAQRRAPEVLVVEKTKSYHTVNCSRVHMAVTKPMTREEAQEANCHPCPLCQPDKQD